MKKKLLCVAAAALLLAGCGDVSTSGGSSQLAALSVPGPSHSAASAVQGATPQTYTIQSLTYTVPDLWQQISCNNSLQAYAIDGYSIFSISCPTALDGEPIAMDSVLDIWPAVFQTEEGMYAYEAAQGTVAGLPCVIVQYSQSLESEDVRGALTSLNHYVIGLVVGDVFYVIAVKSNWDIDPYIDMVHAVADTFVFG